MTTNPHIVRFKLPTIPREIKEVNEFHFRHYNEYLTEGELWCRIDDHEYLRRRGIRWLDIAVQPDDNGEIECFYRVFYRTDRPILISTVTSLVSAALYDIVGHLAWEFYRYPRRRVDTYPHSILSKFFTSYDSAYVKRVL